MKPIKLRGKIMEMQRILKNRFLACIMSHLTIKAIKVVYET